MEWPGRMYSCFHCRMVFSEPDRLFDLSLGRGWHQLAKLQSMKLV